MLEVQEVEEKELSSTQRQEKCFGSSDLQPQSFYNSPPKTSIPAATASSFSSVAETSGMRKADEEQINKDASNALINFGGGSINEPETTDNSGDDSESQPKPTRKTKNKKKRRKRQA